MAGSKIFLLGIIALGLVLASSALAVSPSSISVKVAPENPAPYSDVTITLSSFAANLDSVNIVWLVGGKNVSSGIGRKSFSVTVGASGSETTILARILLPDGQIDKTVILRPATMLLLWQANDSYVPPFYKGKALPTADSEIKIVAMPEIKTSSGIMVNPKNMTYFWKRNYTNEQSGSGYGKNFFNFVGDYLDSTSAISVTASSVDQKYSTEATINVSTVEPEILFYKEDANVGVLWERALSNPHVITGEETIVAAPYFIAPKDIRMPDLVWNWSINDTTVPARLGRENTLPIKADAGASGVSKLRLDIENQWKIFQSASKEINIQF